jgi:hypothetical protein
MRSLGALPALAFLAAACTSAQSNPDRESLLPVGVEALDAAEAAEEQAWTEQGGERANEQQAKDSVADAEPLAAAPAAGAWAEEVPIVGVVGDRPIELPTFLSRLWMRENQAARDVLENLVIARLAMLEADRLSVGLLPEDVDEILEQAYEAMRARLKEAGSELTVEEHIRQNLEMDPGFYHTHLRDDAIVQLLLQRCVRAWALENDRAVVHMLDTDQASAEAFEAGTSSFDDLAAAAGGFERMEIVRSERNELARLAFATEVGGVGGPLVRGGSFLLVRVVEKHDGVQGDWSTVGAAVLASLADGPVAEREFIQWRAAMIPRYKVNLTPFADLVGDPGP